MKIRTAFAAVALTATVALGGATAAMAAEPTTTPSSAPTPEQVAKRCAKVPDALARLDAAQAKAAEQLTRLTEAKAKAEAEGKTRRAERLATLIERLERRIERLESAETKIQDWADANCAPDPVGA